MCSHTIMDRIRNKEFGENLEVAPLSAKILGNRLRWFGHVKRKTYDALMRGIESFIEEGKRSR